MHITIGGNFREAAQVVEAAKRALPQAVAAGAKAVGVATLQATTEAMEHGIYDQPLPASYARYGRDSRTGALLAGETLVQVDQDSFIVTTENSGVAGKDPTQYALERHENRDFPAPWREMGYDDVKDELPGIFSEAFSEAIPGALIAN